MKASIGAWKQASGHESKHYGMKSPGWAWKLASGYESKHWGIKEVLGYERKGLTMQASDTRQLKTVSWACVCSRRKEREGECVWGLQVCGETGVTCVNLNASLAVIWGAWWWVPVQWVKLFSLWLLFKFSISLQAHDLANLECDTRCVLPWNRFKLHVAGEVATAQSC